MQTEGVPQPVYTIHPGDIMVEFTAPKSFEPQNGVVNGVVNGAEGLSEKEKQVLSFVSSNPTATIREIHEALSIGKSTVDRAVKSLKSKGILSREGGDKTGRWILLK